MKKYLLSVFLLFTFCAYCYGQGGIPPRGIITPEEISDVLNQVKSNPTDADTFDKRLETVDVWIMLLIRSGRADEVAKIAPPDTIPKIYELKMAGQHDAACQKIDSLYLELEKIGLPETPGNVKPPSMGEPRMPPPESGVGREIPPHQQTLPSEEEDSADMKQKEVIVDFGVTEGEISPYVFGTTLGPDCDEKEKQLLKEAGFKLLMVMLPIQGDEPSPYTMDDFKKDLKIILDVGATPLFTLIPSAKPRNEKQYFAQVKSIVTYINNEWVKKYPGREWLFRFGNEPDLPFYWRGSREDFLEMYAQWAKIVKAVNPNFIIGGPGLQFGCVQEGKVGSIIDYSKLAPWMTTFLQYLDKKKIPADFVSFHAYSPHIYMSFNRQIKTVHAELARHAKGSPLFGIPKLGNDEWNIMVGKPWSGMYNPVFDHAWTAAHNVCALINMINEGLWLSVRHGGVCRVKLQNQRSAPPGGTSPGRPGAPPPGGQLPPGVMPPEQGKMDEGMEDFLMVTEDGTPKPVYYAFKGVNRLSQTPIKLKTTGNDGVSFAAIAGKSKDNGRVTIVLVNYNSAKSQKMLKGPPVAEDEHRHILKKLSVSAFDTFGGYKLLLKNHPWSSKDKIVMRRYVVSEKDHLGEAENKTFTSTDKIELQSEIASPSIHIITFERQR